MAFRYDGDLTLQMVDSNRNYYNDASPSRQKFIITVVQKKYQTATILAAFFGAVDYESTVAMAKAEGPTHCRIGWDVEDTS